MHIYPEVKMDSDTIAKKLLTAKKSRVITKYINVEKLCDIKFIETMKYISISNFEQKERTIFGGTCEIMGKNVVGIKNEFFLLFKYFKTDEYQKNVNDDFILFGPYPVLTQDAIRATLGVRETMYSLVENDEFGFPHKSVIGFKYDIRFTVDNHVADFLKYKEGDEILLFNGEENG